MVKEIIVMANFFVQLHYQEGGKEVYELKGVDKGIEYDVTYVGEKLPVDDKVKFFAKIKADCDSVTVPELSGMTKHVEICVAKEVLIEHD